MEAFREFFERQIEESDSLFLEQRKKMEQGDLRRTISRIPATHKKLLRSYKFKCEDGNTLKADGGSVGMNDLTKKEIVLAAGWRYGREFCTLHEIAHIVWAHLDDDLHKKWKDLLKKHPIKVKQNAEEIFCMVYGACYAKHPPVTYHCKPLLNFIKNLS